MRHHVAEQQIIAKAIADLRHFAGSRGGMEADGNAELFQARPHGVEITRVPRHVTQRLRSREDTDETQLADDALGFFHRLVGILQRHHRRRL